MTVLNAAVVLWATAPGARAQAGGPLAEQIDECHTTLRFVTGVTPSSDLLELDRAVPPGTELQIRVETFDTYPGRSTAPAQAHEQVSVFGRATVDVPDGLESASSTLEFSHTTPSELLAIEVSHLGVSSGLDSVSATVCVEWALQPTVDSVPPVVESVPPRVEPPTATTVLDPAPPAPVPGAAPAEPIVAVPTHAG